MRDHGVAGYAQLRHGRGLRPLPDGISFKEAAPICDGALTSYNFLVDIGQLKPGQHVLINGASGALGMAAVQIAKSVGAEVSAVCSARNIDQVKNLGADHVINYIHRDFTKSVNAYDMVFDAVGKSSFGKSRKCLKDHGLYLSPVLSFSLLLTMMRTSLFGRKKARFQATGLRKKQELKEMLERIEAMMVKGQLKTVIDKMYTIDEISEAHQYVDSGRKKGNIVILFK